LSAGALSVLHITESLDRAYGGQAVACAELASQLSRAGASVSVATIDAGHAGSPVPLDRRVQTFKCAPSWPRRLRRSAVLDRTLEQAAPSLVHVHGLWRLYLRQAANFAHSGHLPLIVSAHGMLHPRARGQRGALKSFVRWLGQDAILQHATCLHATAHEEAEEIFALGLGVPVAVIPWGVDVPAAEPRAAAPEPPVVLYLGRFHPTKGLDSLLRAWARVARRFPGARLRLAGFDDGGFRARCESLAASLGISASAAFQGPVAGNDRDRLFAESSLLVLPSPAENFGLVIPEALVRGVPVITTTGTPWAAVVQERCGWQVAPDEDALAGALTVALETPPARLHDMAQRGRDFVRTAFAWEAVAASMLDLYAWSLGRAPKPSFVRTA
jgi:glycosyltransferase involved in cell wall biosynthesis